MPGGCFCFCCLDYVIKKCEIHGIFWSVSIWEPGIFFILQTNWAHWFWTGPLGHHRIQVRSWSWPATESDRENPASKRGVLTVPRVFGADVKDKNLVKKLMIPTSLGPFFTPEDGVFFGGEDRLFCKKPMLAMKLRTVWVRARMLSWF